MPRAKNPIADLAAHRAKRADLDAKEEQLKTEAAQYLGSLMMKVGLDTWPNKTLREVITELGKAGPETAHRRLGISSSKSGTSGGNKAALETSD